MNILANGFIYQTILGFETKNHNKEEMKKSPKQKINSCLS